MRRNPANHRYIMTTKKHSNPLRLNVGFIIHETPGYTRDFDVQLPVLDLEDDLQVKDFNANFTLSRTQKGILVEGRLAAELPANCVRCLEAILHNLDTTFTELYAFNHSSETEEELIVPEEGYIDLNPIVREYLQLDTPTNPLCREDCAGLCPTCGVNHNHTECDCTTDAIDPRMAKLKELLDNDE